MAANREQIEYWNGDRGRQWVEEQEAMDRALAPFEAALLAAATPVLGERAVDVGCGCGATTLALAEAVGATGRVLGVDVSAPMLARAGERTRGLPQVMLVRADAASHGFPRAGFDLVVSRFGVMFFDEPVSAFRNVGAALAPGGRLAFICWRSLAENPWLALAAAAVSQVVPPASPPPPADAPGPLALADGARTAGILAQAGLADIVLTRFDHGMPLGDGKGLEAAVDRAMSVGPAGRLLAGADAATWTAARDLVRAALAPHLVDEDVTLGGSAWLVTARAPNP